MNYKEKLFILVGCKDILYVLGDTITASLSWQYVMWNEVIFPCITVKLDRLEICMISVCQFVNFTKVPSQHTLKGSDLDKDESHVNILLTAKRNNN